MEKIFNRQRLIFGVLLIALIMIGELILHRFELAAWPAFMAMVFFFLGGANVKNIPGILIGGLFGILCLPLVQLFIAVSGPSIGAFPAKLIFIAVFVFSIVLLKDAIPYVFNDYAFMYFLVAALGASAPNPAPYQWLAIELIGGGLFILGILGIRRLLGPPSHDHSISA